MSSTMSTTADSSGEAWYGWAWLSGAWERLTHGHATRTAAAIALDQALAEHGLSVPTNLHLFITGGSRPPDRHRRYPRP
jgi:hypothetical protein